MTETFDATAFQVATHVSRETLEKLDLYTALLKKWQRRINLVSRTTLPDVWRRHLMDSAQIAPLIEGDGPSCIDMGTGAGFPGMVLAIMGLGSWTLIDSDHRKIAFLQEVARQTETAVNLRSARLETLEGLSADIITARACAPLAVLLGYAAPLMHADSMAIFLKGKGMEAELAASGETWQFACNSIESTTDPLAKILVIQDIKRV